jgi:hypothetical protein
MPRGVLYPEIEPLLKARDVRRTVLSKADEVACAVSIGGVEGGEEADEDGPLSRSIASGSNADWGSFELSSSVDGRVGPKFGESITTTCTSSKCSRSA